MNFKLLTEHHLEFLSLKGDYTGWCESTLVKMPHCWKSHVAAQIHFLNLQVLLSVLFRVLTEVRVHLHTSFQVSKTYLPVSKLIKEGHYQPASGRRLEWRFAGQSIVVEEVV